MTHRRLRMAALLLLPALATYAQKAEPQISFAQQEKPHSYYVQQADLWWQQLQRDKTAEDAWYHYFRACRNAQGTADWNRGFVKDGPNLKLGNEIVDMMAKHIPNSFTHNYLSYLQNGIGTTNGDKLMKAYEMRPDFEGIHSSVVTYAVSKLDKQLRRSVNREWYKTNYLSPQLMIYGYNVLMSLEPDAIILTYNDNDSYPLWMLQDALDIRPDVEVVNVDFMLIDGYRDANLALMQVKPQVIPQKDKNVDIYQTNWTKIVQHILGNYPGQRPLYIGMNMNPELYAGFEDKFTVSGLALRYKGDEQQMPQVNKKLYETTFLLDQLKAPILIDPNQRTADRYNLSYLNMFKILYDKYKTDNDPRADEVKALAYQVVNKLGDEQYMKIVKEIF